MKYLLVAVLALSLNVAATPTKNTDTPELKSPAQAKPDTDTPCPLQRQWTFSWPITESCNPTRGGTTTGPEVIKTNEPDPRWIDLQEPGLSDFERDRRAILAMAGGFKVTFEFIEVLGFTPNYEPAKPYQSWATEYVYVVEDKQDFISLQHIMVMSFVDAEGNIQGPMVMKHWRQDWQYQQATILEYQGERHWEQVKHPEQTLSGKWTQTVYQVDDSPRYASFGGWRHNTNFSTWTGSTTWRPLPRREHSVRDDYSVLEGKNTQTITATGWIHEQENLKRLSTDSTDPAEYVAKELGFNRYRRIQDFDFSAGDTYWKNTGAYWALVRETLEQIIQKQGEITLKARVDGQPLFMPLFDYAQKLNEGDSFDKDKARAFVQDTFSHYTQH